MSAYGPIQRKFQRWSLVVVMLWFAVAAAGATDHEMGDPYYNYRGLRAALYVILAFNLGRWFTTHPWGLR